VTTCGFINGLDPNLHIDILLICPSANTVTFVFPDTGPLMGSIRVIFAFLWYSKLNAFLLFVSTPLLETSTGQGPIGIAGVTHLISDDDM
jgi:hypothetical protein